MQKALLLIGPEPPPATGMEIATRNLASELDNAGVPYIRVDTADAADELGNRSRWTARNVSLAFGHVYDALRACFSHAVGAVYVPIAQEFPALIRDLTFIMSAHLARKPVIVHLHGATLDKFYNSRSKPVRFLLKRILGRASLGIVLSEPLRSTLECLLPPERIVAVPNGIDFAPPLKRRGKATVDILFLSVLYPWKGVLVFIEAFALAFECSPAVRASVAGYWPSDAVRTDAMNLAQQLGVADRLRFPGFVRPEQKADLFSNADIFCFPSLVPEGQGLVVLEAMAAGVPVVATGWPGVADTVIDGETGLLVASASPALFAEKLVYLVEHPEERERLGAAGRARYERLYTQQAFGERVTAALRPVLERAHIPMAEGAGMRRTT